MTIHEGINSLPRLNFAVVTSGTFDGVHVGHQKILRRLVDLTRSNNGESAVMTFWPHPRMVLEKECTLELLNTFEEKASLIQRYGIDHLIKIEFTSEFSQLSSQDFIEKYLVEKIQTKILVIGYDHRFGKNREGSFEYLNENSHELGFRVEEIPEQDVNDIAVSSTKIRNALKNGEIDLANSFLSKPYLLTGEVIKGDQIGRTLGYPTANLDLKASYKLVPKDGIYAVKVNLEDRVYNGVMSIGLRPTFDGNDRRIEVHIFDFDQNIYGRWLKVELIDRIRDEKKFSSQSELVEQMKLDEDQSRKILLN